MYRFLIISIASLLTLSLHAKGLDEINARSEEEKQADNKAAEEQQEKVEKAAEQAKEVEAATSKEVEKVVERSNTSKALDNKLHLSTSFGWVRIPKAKLGEMAAGGMADFSLLWNFFHESNHKLLASFRYAPIYSENKIDGHSYYSQIDGYHLGAHYLHSIFDKDFALLATAELGYLLVYMQTRDSAAVSDSSEKNEIGFTIGTGFEWVIQDKLNVGPRLYYGFGNIQTLQFSGALTLAF